MTDRLKDKLVLFLAGLGIVSYFVIIVVELCSTPRFQHLTNLTAPDTEVEVCQEASKRPACVIVQAPFGMDREPVFVFRERELYPTKTRLRVRDTGENIEKYANQLWKATR